MKPIYVPPGQFNPGANANELAQTMQILLALPWLEMTEARKEYFMFDGEPIQYTYGGAANGRTYTSVKFEPVVKNIMEYINEVYNKNYNVCFLNRYDSSKNQLGWHADDSPEMNMEHDIAVVSFGAAREIWWKDKMYKGEIPAENRQLLESGSLFVMPAGFQRDHYHRIPKSDRECGTRISLTFRNYLKQEK